MYGSCHLCVSVIKLPKELYQYEPELFPDHPGQAMNADILKRSGQLILVNTDLFSSNVSACFAESERADDQAVAIIQVVTPVNSNKPSSCESRQIPWLI